MTRLEDLSERIDSRRAQIGVVGLGYVGLPLALEFAKAGFRVTGFELDEDDGEEWHVFKSDTPLYPG